MNILYLAHLIAQVPTEVLSETAAQSITVTPTEAIAQIPTQVATAAASAAGESVFTLFMQSGYMGKGILILLVIVSIISWGIALERYFFFKKYFKEIKNFQNIVRGVKDLAGIKTSVPEIEKSPMADFFLTAYNDAEQSAASKDKSIDIIDEMEDFTRTLEKSSVVEASKLEKRLIFLATAGATTPFIGLFGTVWGIMNSFRGIAAQSSASFAVIAGGIAEALVNTAAGLAAAIPAVIFYNFFVSRIKAFGSETNSFSKDFLRIIKKQLKQK